MYDNGTCGQGVWKGTLILCYKTYKNKHRLQQQPDSCWYSDQPTRSTLSSGKPFSLLYVQTGTGAPTTAYTTHTAGFFAWCDGGRGVRLTTHHASNVEIKNA